MSEGQHSLLKQDEPLFDADNIIEDDNQYSVEVSKYK